MAEPENAAPQDAPATPTATDEGPSGTEPVSEGGDVGRTATAAPTTRDDATGPDEDSFFDPTDLPDELKPAYKQMQAAFTRKTQGLKEQRDKIAAYDAFNADPVGSIQNLAKHYGLNLTRAEAQAAADGASGNGESWQPKSWDEVIKRIQAETRESLLNELEPVLRDVRDTKRSQIERDLDEQVPEWRQYEEEMTAALNAHPTLVKDPIALARLALPERIFEARATQRALKKLEDRGRSSKVSGGSQTQRPPAGPDPNKRQTFHEAVQNARQQLEQDGRLYVSSD